MIAHTITTRRIDTRRLEVVVFDERLMVLQTEVRTRTKIQKLSAVHGHDRRCGIDGLNGQVTNAFGDAIPDDLMEDGQFGVHGAGFGFAPQKAPGLPL